MNSETIKHFYSEKGKLLTIKNMQMLPFFFFSKENDAESTNEFWKLSGCHVLVFRFWNFRGKLHLFSQVQLGLIDPWVDLPHSTERSCESYSGNALPLAIISVHYIFKNLTFTTNARLKRFSTAQQCSQNLYFDNWPFHFFFWCSHCFGLYISRTHTHF